MRMIGYQVALFAEEALCSKDRSIAEVAKSQTSITHYPFHNNNSLSKATGKSAGFRFAQSD